MEYELLKFTTKKWHYLADKINEKKQPLVRIMLHVINYM